MTISFKTSENDADKIKEIVDRAFEEIDVLNDKGFTCMDVLMDITACHANGCPLDLEKMLAAPKFDFAHDVCGIIGHLDRSTGQLVDCFLPRCAA